MGDEGDEPAVPKFASNANSAMLPHGAAHDDSPLPTNQNHVNRGLVIAQFAINHFNVET